MFGPEIGQKGKDMAGNHNRINRQLALFGSRSLNPVGELKRELALAAKSSGLSRPQIVDQINTLIGIERLRTKGKDGLVTLAMLDKWLAAEATESVIPLKLLPTFCRVTDSLGPLQALAAPLEAAVIGPAERILLEMAQAQETRKQAARKERRLAEQYEELKR